MSDIAIEFNQVWKKFKKGEKYDSLRDLIPSIARLIISGNHQGIDLLEREFWAIKDVSFEVKRGEALGIIGPNGAGKSTILKLLSGLLRPNKGEIKVKGRLSALIEVSAGFHPDLTGRENIYLNGAILGMRKSEIDKKLDEIVEFSGLENFLDTPVKRYSSGMYARLGFSVAAHVDPDILLIDEVLSVGDMRFQQKCLDRMLSIARNEATIIFVSHNLESVQILCPQTLYLNAGQIVLIGKTSEVIKEYICSDRSNDILVNQIAQIDHVMLSDDKGNPRIVFGPGDKAQLRLKIKCIKPLDQCLLGLIVKRATDGLPICDYNLSLEKMGNNSVQSVGNETWVTISFNTNILRGTYAISLHIYHYPTAQFLCQTNNITTFYVEERISWRGVAHLNPILETKEKI